jgi:hypothetical protein
MLEKYDLNKMLEEIKEDEQTDDTQKKHLSQDMIRKMALERLKKSNERRS